MHRDLKLQNLLIDKQVPSGMLQDFDKLLERRPQLKLCDFGTSKARMRQLACLVSCSIKGNLAGFSG